MITAVEVQTNLREYDTKNRRLVLGVSGASLNLIKSLSDYYSLPMDSNIFDRVFERNHVTKWDTESLLNLFKDAVDEIEVALVINQGGVVLNYTPIDAIALMLLNLNHFQKISDKEQAEVDSIINQALTLCPRFTHEKTISTDLLANLKAGVYHRYYEKLGCVVIQVSDILSDNSARLDFITRVIEILGKSY